MNKIIKFFSLVKYNKKDYIYQALRSLNKGINPIIHVIFIERVIFAISNNDFLLLKKFLLYYFIALISYEILFYFFRKVGWVITIPKSESVIYNICLRKFIQMDNNEVEKIGVGKIIAILENGRLRWAEMLATSIEKGIALFILLLYSFIVTVKHGLFFTFGFFFLLILSVIVLFFVNKYQFIYRNKRSELRNDRLRLVTKILMSKNEILQSNKLDEDLEKIDKYSNKTAAMNVLMSNGRTVQNRFIPFIIGICLFLFVYFYSKDVINGNIKLSEFVGVTSIFLVINSAILNFIAFYIDLTKDFIDIEKMWHFFEDTKKIEGYEEGNDFNYKNGDIEIKNMIFYYYEGKNIFENFNLSVGGGKITALVGNSGSGKTTLVKLISGYIKANSGEIIIDGQRLSETSLKSYYKNIGYLTQEPSVFDGSIINNLTYAIDRDLENGELEQVIKDSKCEFIYDLPFGLETEIGERGVKLSGGQKQRLAIAKIMLKNPKIIILDEPTSALDSFSEDQITKALNNLFIGKTVIIVAHRLQTVKHADNILVFEDGKVVENGNHEELVKKGGIYAKMLELQSGF